jgi:hypothetical protein
VHHLCALPAGTFTARLKAGNSRHPRERRHEGT